MADEQLRDTQNWGTGDWASQIMNMGMNTKFRPSTFYAMGKAPGDIIGAGWDKATTEARSRQMGADINKQYAAQATDPTLQRWGATPEVAARYQRKYIDETPWYSMGGLNPFVSRGGRMGWTRRDTGEEVGAEGKAEIEAARAQARTRDQTAQTAAQAQTREQARTGYDPKSLLANPAYRAAMQSASQRGGPQMGALMMLAGADPEAFKVLEKSLMAARQSPRQAAAANAAR